MSAAGEALQMFPASVARWRSGQAPTVLDALGEEREAREDGRVRLDVGERHRGADGEPAVRRPRGSRGARGSASGRRAAPGSAVPPASAAGGPVPPRR